MKPDYAAAAQMIFHMQNHSLAGSDANELAAVNQLRLQASPGCQSCNGIRAAHPANPSESAGLSRTPACWAASAQGRCDSLANL